MMDLFYRHRDGSLVDWFRSDRMGVWFRGTGFIFACPIDADGLRAATMMEF